MIVGTYSMNSLDCFVKCSLDHHILDDDKGELIRVLGKCIADFVGSVLGTDGTTDFIASLEERLDNMRSDEPGGAGHENRLI